MLLMRTQTQQRETKAAVLSVEARQWQNANTAERNKGSSALGGGQAVAERGSREGSGQRMSCQPIAARLLVAGMGKSPPGRGP
nr:PREDICTED: mitotic-spindle organizing protein 2-like [Equus przewalskii]